MLIDVPGDCPNELQSSQEGGESLLDDLQIASGNVLELSVQCVQELDEVLCLGVLLLEDLVLSGVVVKLIAVGPLLIKLHHLDDLLHLRLVELLVESIERGGSLPPVLGLTLG